MSKMIEYTLEIYKSDRRIKKDERYGKNKVGLRFIEAIDYAPMTPAAIKAVVAKYESNDFVVVQNETYKTSVNMMSGTKFQERYDTPYFCSPSSETYWSM